MASKPVLPPFPPSRKASQPGTADDAQKLPRKLALLVGCNYPESEYKLNGCINDVATTRAFLKKYFGFVEYDITVLLDTDKSYQQPTGKNIKDKLADMVNNAQEGDVLYFHFSGHGTQIPNSKTDKDHEADGLDEAICPTDFNLITDDDLRALLAPLNTKKNVKFTMVSDCCHSGGMLDHEPVDVVIAGDKSQTRDMDAAVLQAAGKADRQLAPDQVCQELSTKLGQPVAPTAMRSALGTIFAGDATLKLRSLLGKGIAGAADAAVGAVNSAMAGAAGALLNTSTQAVQQAARSVIKARGGFSMCCGADVLQIIAPELAPGESNLAGVANHTPAGSATKLSGDIGILITGCQSHETSADAYPSADEKHKAFGALTNSINTVLDAHFAKHPPSSGVYPTNRTVVMAARALLLKSGFTQNPCLECSKNNADTPFISM